MMTKLFNLSQFLSKYDTLIFFVYQGHGFCITWGGGYVHRIVCAFQFLLKKKTVFFWRVRYSAPQVSTKSSRKKTKKLQLHRSMYYERGLRNFWRYPTVARGVSFATSLHPRELVYPRTARTSEGCSWKAQGGTPNKAP